MFKSISKVHSSVISVAAASMILFAGTAVAGPKEDKVKPGKPAKGNIVEVATAVSGMMNDTQGVPEFTYLLAAVDCLEGQELEDVLSILTGKRKYTLFAPVNDAFRALQGVLGVPEEDQAPDVTCEVDTILDAGTLFTVLAYHVTEGQQFANRIFNKNNPREIDTVAGFPIYSTTDVTLIDGFPQTVTVAIPNVRASNGVIHAVDTVLLPFNPLAEEDE